MATGFDNQIVGVCRFSYLGAGGFEASKLDDAALMDLLYDPARMARRFAFFEKLCLPSLHHRQPCGELLQLRLR